MSRGGFRPGAPIPDQAQVEFDILASPIAGTAAMRGGALRVFGYLATTVVTVVSAAVLFRYLGPARAGQYVAALAVVGIVGSMLDGGLAWLAVREAAVRRGADRRAVIADLLGMRLVLSVVAIALAAAFAVAVGYDVSLVAGIALASIGAALASFQLILAALLVAELRLGWVTAIDSFRQVVAMALVLVFVWSGFGLLAFLAVPIPAALAALTWTILLVRKDIRLAASFRLDTWRVLFRDVVPYAVATAAGLLYFRVAVVVLSLIASKHETGLYSAAFRIVEVLMLVPQLAVGAVLPVLARAAREDHARLSYGVGRTFRAAAVFGGGIAVVFALGAPFAIAVVAGPDFASADDILAIHALGLGIALVTSVFTYALLSLRMHRELLVANLVALAVSVLLTLVLGHAWGGKGAATATVVAEVSLAGCAAGLLVRRHPSLRPEWSFLLRVVAAGLATAALAFIPGVPSVVLALAGAAVYSMLALALRLVPEEVLTELRRVRELRNAR